MSSLVKPKPKPGLAGVVVKTKPPAAEPAAEAPASAPPPSTGPAGMSLLGGYGSASDSD